MTRVNPFETVVVAELCSSGVQPHWPELGYEPHIVRHDLVDACVADPTALQRRLAEQIPAAPAILAIACDRLPVAPVSTAHWDSCLYEPLTRCFTLVRGLTPWMVDRTRGGHVVAFLDRSALLPDGVQGTSAVLGRSVLGLFESLRATLLLGRTRVTICFTAANEPVEVFQTRVSGVLRSRPLYSFPASLGRQEIGDYFSPLLRELAAAPRGTPLPGVGPRAEVYRPD